MTYSSHDGSMQVHSGGRLVSGIASPSPTIYGGMQVMAAGWDFADVQNQFDGIVRNKAVY